MARIRSIHPGLLTDEAFMSLTVECPLAIPLLIGLWTEADDAGIFQWKPMVIKARVLPAVSEDVGRLLGALVSAGFLMRYEIDGKEYGAIRNFMRWQRPKKAKYVHPVTEEVRSYVGTGTEQVPQDDGTGTEIPPQREEEGGRKKESASAASSAPAPKMTGLTEMERRIIAVFRDAKVEAVSFPDIGHAALWQAQGMDPEICAAVVGEAVRRGKRIRSLAWFDERIREAHEKRAPAPPLAAPEIHRDLWEVRVSQYRTQPDRWPNGLGKPPDHPGCKAPPDILAKHGYREAAA